MRLPPLKIRHFNFHLLPSSLLTIRLFSLSIGSEVRVRTGSPDCTADRTFTIEITLANTKKPKKERIIPIYRNPLYVAKEYARMIESGEAKSESDVARNLGISRVRVNQFITLLKLEASIIRTIEKLGDPLRTRIITERMLRPYVRNLKEKGELIKIISTIP